jgi:hypothetical protein
MSQRYKEEMMEKLVPAEMANIKGGLTLGCTLYALESGLVAGVAGMAFGPFGAGIAFGFLMHLPGNPCRT